MSLADTQYLGIIENILEHGIGMVKIQYRYCNVQIATSNYAILVQRNFDFDYKICSFQNGGKELLWIWQMQSNDVRKLQEMNVRVWDEWMREDGTIGTRLWLQIAKYKQFDKLIKTIKEDPG